jgi:hypothetical protein
MHRLAVHNVKTANGVILTQCAVQRGEDIVSHLCGNGRAVVERGLCLFRLRGCV